MKRNKKAENVLFTSTASTQIKVIEQFRQVNEALQLTGGLIGTGKHKLKVVRDAVERLNQEVVQLRPAGTAR